MAADDESRGEYGMAGSPKSQNGTSSAGRCARYQSVQLRAAARNRGSEVSRYAAAKPRIAQAWPRAQVESADQALPRSRRVTPPVTES